MDSSNNNQNTFFMTNVVRSSTNWNNHHHHHLDQKIMETTQEHQHNNNININITTTNNFHHHHHEIPMCSGLIWPNNNNPPLQISSSSSSSPSSSSSFFNEILGGMQLEEEAEAEEEEEEEELGAMKEMMYKIAAMQPVEIDPATIRKPKRRNVKISEDPQSVAARHRRERISERIRILQRLVPGGTKMDTASMLDEAIRYVKFLKKQIRFLQSPTITNHSIRITTPPLPTAAADTCWPFPSNMLHSSVGAAAASIDVPGGMGFGTISHGHSGDASSTFDLHKVHHQCLNHAIKTQPRLNKKSIGIGNCNDVLV